MFCPQCRSEYRPGFTHCNDCDVDLVAELPSDSHQLNLVKVFETGDPAISAIAESLLDSAQIECVIKNKRRPDVFGTSTLLGPTQFCVREEEAAQAPELLAELLTGE